VGILTFCLLAWFVINQSGILATSQSRLIFWTGAIFAVLIVTRREVPIYSTLLPESILCWMAGAGALLAVSGIITDVHQFQWLGILLLAYAGFGWSLPEIHAEKVASALFVLYWAHPLPGNLFGAVRLAMQRLSVGGAEWCLHTFSIPVWADGLILRTGMRAFEVPEACSGMNTAMIVVVCALGSGALLNLTLLQRLLLMVAGFVQVLIMNSARIALMVSGSWDKPPEWSLQYLHDSTAALLLLMIALIQCEAWLWSWLSPQYEEWRDRHTGQRSPGQFLGQNYNIPLPRLELVALAIPAVVLCFVALMVLGQRSPDHRALMIAQVATELAQHDPEQAERAAQAAAALEPDKLAHKLLVARIELMRGKHEQALARLQRLRPVPRDDTTIQLMAWGMLGAGKLEQAQALLSRLPASQSAHPGIAMCAAELAVLRNDAASAASNVVLAAAWPVLVDRVRRTYPFLARHGQWPAIADSAADLPFRDEVQFRIMLVALNAEDDLAQVARLLKANRSLWFGRPAFLPNLQELALRHPEADWQQIFSDSLTACLGRLSVDELTAMIEPCFLLGRPDLAWLAYHRLSLRDPQHPALTLIPARFAASWFTFRGGAIRTVSPSRTLLDLRPLFRTAAAQAPWQHLLAAIPLGPLMAAGPSRAQVSQWVASGLTELARRETNGTLTYQQFALYERSLEWAQREGDALKVLDRMERQFPDRSVEILSRRAAFHRQRALWQPLYETLRRIKALRPSLDRTMQFTLAETLPHLEMSVCALEMSAATARRRPMEEAGQLLLASIWAQFGHAEEALFALRAVKGIPSSQTMATLLWQTGRYTQASLMYDMLGMEREAARRPSALPALPPAESVMSWPGHDATMPPFSRETLDEQIRQDVSPFLRNLHTLTRDWISGRERQRLANPTVWMEAGRDSLEQVTALHRLAFLAVEAGDRPLARRALDEALRLMPSARLLWRMQIALSGGEADLIAAARAACPDDPEIWLAELMLHIRTRRLAAAATAVREVSANNRYSAATVVRAGDALLRAGDAATAAMAAKQVLTQSREYLPACLLGLDAAVASKDADTAITLAKRIAELAPDPLPFYRMAVQMGMRRPEGQRSLTRALDALIASEPDNPEWRLRLGTIYFNEGLFEFSHQAFGRWTLRPPTNAPAGVLIMMAESARQSGDLPQSVAVLREAFRRHPTDIHVINSLAYTLAQSPATAMEARSFLPRLMEAAPTASILDTLAVIRMQSGEKEAVQRSVKEALAKLKPGDEHWREIHLNAAAIECTLGHAAEAERLLKRAREQPPPKGSMVDRRMASLQLQILELKQKAPRTGK
jgi:exosortase/archaeosortase family protein